MLRDPIVIETNTLEELERELEATLSNIHRVVRYGLYEDAREYEYIAAELRSRIRDLQNPLYEIVYGSANAENGVVEFHSDAYNDRPAILVLLPKPEKVN